MNTQEVDAGVTIIVRFCWAIIGSGPAHLRLITTSPDLSVDFFYTDGDFTVEHSSPDCLVSLEQIVPFQSDTPEMQVRMQIISEVSGVTAAELTALSENADIVEALMMVNQEG